MNSKTIQIGTKKNIPRKEVPVQQDYDPEEPALHSSTKLPPATGMEAVLGKRARTFSSCVLPDETPV